MDLKEERASVDHPTRTESGLPHDMQPLPAPFSSKQGLPVIGPVLGLCALSTVLFLAVGAGVTFCFWFLTEAAFAGYEPFKPSALFVLMLAQVWIYLVCVRIFAQSWLGAAAASMAPGTPRNLGIAMVAFGLFIPFEIIIQAVGVPTGPVRSLLAPELGVLGSSLLFGFALSSPFLAFGAIGWFLVRANGLTPAPAPPGTNEDEDKSEGDRTSQG